MKKRILILICLVLLGIGVIFAEGRDPVPFSANDISGKKISLESFKGQVVLLDFWASWCRPCKMEIPNLVKIHQKYASKKFAIISISLDRDVEGAKKFVQDNQMSWIHIMGAEAFGIVEKYNIFAIPSMFVIDANGKIVAEQLQGEELGAKIAEIIGK